MPKRIGLNAPFVGLCIFSVLFLPAFHQHFPKGPIALILFSPQIYFLLASIFITRIRKLRPADIGIPPMNRTKHFFFGLGIGWLPIAALFLLCMMNILPQEIPRESFFRNRSFSDLFLLLILAPITEEVFFRGILFSALRESYSVWVAVIASSLLFMLGHPTGGPTLSFWGLSITFSIGPFVLGVLASLLFARTGSILPGLGLHFAGNTYSLILSHWFPDLFRKVIFLFP